MKLITGYLGHDLKIEGSLSTQESLRIDCTYIGNISSANMIIIGEFGKILGDINASRNAEQMYSLVKNKEVDENISEAALDALCNFGDLRYFWKLNDLCKQPSSVVISNNLNLLLKNFYRVANKKKFGKEYGRIIVEILSSNDDLVSDEIRLESIEQIKQLDFKNKTLKKELVIQLKKLSKGNSELSKRAELELGEKRFKIE